MLHAIIRLKTRILWIGFLLTTLLLVLNSRTDRTLPTSQLPFAVHLLVSPMAIALWWWLLVRFRSSIQRVVGAIPLPPFVKYVLLGSLVGAFLLNNFAISFNLNRDDIIKGQDPATLLNSLLWVGPFAAVLTVYYLFARRYRLTPEKVFWVSGLIGVLIEQNFLVPILLITLNPGALVLFFALLPVYGVTYGAIWLAMPPGQLPVGQRTPTRWRYIGLAVLVTLAFYVGAGIWWGMSDLVLGTKLLSQP